MFLTPFLYPAFHPFTVCVPSRPPVTLTLTLTLTPCAIGSRTPPGRFRRNAFGLGFSLRGDCSYSTFLSSHGGSSNAYTDTEDTVYFFDVGSDYLGGALDRFAQFFIAPQVRESMRVVV